MTALTFILGLCVGSFLNVLIDRLPKGEQVFWGRSYCDSCRKSLSWYDLIPLVSFILLGRRCRYCRALISWQYPLVELTTGILFILTSTLMIRIIRVPEDIFYALYWLVIISGLIVIFFTDLKYRIIPDQINLILASTSLFFLYQSSMALQFPPPSRSPFGSPRWSFGEAGHLEGVLTAQSLFVNHLSSAIAMFLLFLLLAFLTHGRGMGLGDVKLAFCMGLILGFPKTLIAFYLSFLTGAIFSLILILLGKKTMKSTIPFGPFLVVSTMVSLFYGQSLWGWFKGILGI